MHKILMLFRRSADLIIPPFSKEMLAFLKFRPSVRIYSTIQTSSSPTPSEYGEAKSQYDSEQEISLPRRRSWLRRHCVAIGVHSILTIGNLIIYVAASTKTWDPAHANSKYTLCYLLKLYLQ